MVRMAQGARRVSEVAHERVVTALHQARDELRGLKPSSWTHPRRTMESPPKP
jgi:hypothetical protein